MDFFARYRPTRSPQLTSPAPHAVLGGDMLNAVEGNNEQIFLAMGCFWGAEKLMWELGATMTAVGYQGGTVQFPSYQEVCTGTTGHAESVRVVYDPDMLPLPRILQAFFESHDPTTLNRQGNDVGTQYRSAIFATTADQVRVAKEMMAGYEAKLREAGRGPIVTELHEPPAPPFFYAEPYHQQYLHKNPGGYQCHARTGIACPLPEGES